MNEKDQTIRLPETWAADWILDRRLGSGAFSTVYRAVRRDRPGVEAAIKVISIPANEAEAAALRAEGMNESQSQSFFDAVAREYISEIDLMEDLKGTPNIVSIEDYKVVRKPDGIGNNIFIRMELLKPLDTVLRERTLTEQEVIRLGIDLCSALELCEARKIIHRDIKPANIFVNDKASGYVFYKLGDFGIARSMDSMTRGLSKKGTPNYMAPEVFFGKPYDHRADLYSLGITLYRLLNNNQLPFISDQEMTPSAREEALSRRLTGEKLPPPAAAGRAFAQVILKACESRPEDRFRSASEMKAALQELLNGGKPVLQSAKKKNMKGFAAAMALCLLLALAAGGILLGTNKNTPEANESVPAAGFAETATPTTEPTATPTAEPTATPTAEPTATPTAEPTATPTAEPTATPTAEPTATPTAEPTATPTIKPTETPTTEPTATPTTEPTAAPTGEPTVTPDMEIAETAAVIPASENPETSRPATGEMITFGRYEQDGDLSNGPEEIEWIVLDVRDGKYLLLSRFGLEAKPYNAVQKSVTWENCTLREWLNGDFMAAAFLPEEQALILQANVGNDATQGFADWKTDGGNDTTDRVFLLSYSEANRYLGVTDKSGDNAASRVSPTAMAVRNGAWDNEKNRTAEGAAAGWWWLRSPGYNKGTAAFVRAIGSLSYTNVRNVEGCVRPALWMDPDAAPALTAAPEPENVPEEKRVSSPEREARLEQYRTVENTVRFGRYEQDNDLGNGPEEIEWIVLDVQDGKCLLMSKYALDGKKYHGKRTAVTWETCDLRYWLNNGFLETAFTDEEQEAILVTEVDNSPSQRFPRWKVNGGNNTRDKVFLLSYAEGNRYLGLVRRDEPVLKAKIAPTPYAVANGVAKSKGAKTSEGRRSCAWWLRSPGIRQDEAGFVVASGTFTGTLVNWNCFGVCPVLWMDPEKLD